MPITLRRSLLASAGLAVATMLFVAGPAAAEDAAQPAATSETQAPATQAPSETQAPAAEAAKPTPPPDTVLAHVNGKPITQGDVELAETDLDPQFAKMPPEQRRAAALSALIEIRVMADKAVADGIDKDPEFQRRMELLHERALHSALVDKEVSGAITDADLKKRYDEEMAKQAPVNEVHARHILVKTKEEAEAIIKELDKGGDFEKIAKEKSTDGSAPQGGDLGYFTEGQMVPEFAKAAFALPVGKYTEQPVQTQFGWHIIKVEDKRIKQPPSFDQVKAQLRQVVLRDKYFAMVKETRAAAKVDITDPDLKKEIDTMDNAQ
jgi:peptidyl-prolyl cis-trans isomerase C